MRHFVRSWPLSPTLTTGKVTVAIATYAPLRLSSSLAIGLLSNLEPTEPSVPSRPSKYLNRLSYAFAAPLDAKSSSPKAVPDQANATIKKMCDETLPLPFPVENEEAAEYWRYFYKSLGGDL